MSKAIQLEAGFQLSEGVNMARQVNIMQAEINETEVIKDARAHSNICWGCGEIGHFYRDCRNPNKRQFRDKMKQGKNLKFKWQMEGEKDFDEEPVDALVSRLIRRGDTYKGKFKKYRECSSHRKNHYNNKWQQINYSTKNINHQSD